MYRIILLVMIFLIIFSGVGECLKNPVDAAGDTIRRNINTATDDVISDFKVSMHNTWMEIKAAIRSLLGFILEVVTVLAVGWAFSFLVDKRTAKMIKLVVVLCAFTELIRLLGKFIGFVGGS